MPRGSKPGEHRGGRKKGTPNKLTTTIKEALEGAFADVGGREYLAKMANDEPKAFMALLGKAMPQQVDAHLSGNIGMPPITLAPSD